MVDTPRRPDRPSALRELGRFLGRFEFAAGSLGFMLGLLITNFDQAFPGRDRSKNLDFLRSPDFLVWMFLIGAQFGFWFSAAPYQWRAARTIRSQFGLVSTFEMRAKLVLAILLFVFPVIVILPSLPITNDLPHLEAKVRFVNLVSLFVAFIALRGIWYVRASLDGPSWSNTAASDQQTLEKEKLQRYLFLRKSLQGFIVFLGAMISLGTIARGSLRRALLSEGIAPGLLPPELILLHGAYFSALLALVYIPTYTRMMTIGSEMVESAFPLSSPSLDLRNLSDWQSNRKCLEDLLQLNANALENLRASMSILAPLATSGISLLLGEMHGSGK